MSVLKTIFANPHHRNKIAPYRRAAFSYVNRWAGEAFLREGNRLSAMLSFVKAGAIAPHLFKDPYFIANIKKCIL